MTVDSSGAVPLRRMVAIGLGNALEFYDFMIFSFFAVQIGHAFFPAEFGARGLLYTLATFGVGYQLTDHYSLDLGLQTLQTPLTPKGQVRFPWFAFGTLADNGTAASLSLAAAY